MPRPEDSVWAVSVAQVASRPGQSKPIDTVFPAPAGIGDSVVGVREGADIRVVGSFDSIVDGLVFTGPVTAECTRCLKPIDPDWTVPVTAFFPYDSGACRDDRRTGHGKDDVEILAGEDESEDVYPLSADGAFADMESLLRDTLVEALPLGLCPQCGADLNEDPDHHHDVTDIRFAALEQLKAQLEEEQTGR